MNTFKKNLPAILMILLGIAIGVLLIIDAVRLTEIIFRVFGIALIVLAIVMAIRYLIDRKHDEARSVSLVTAIVAFIIGMVLAFGARLIVDAGSTLCAIFYGAVMLVNGFLKIGEYFSIKKQGATVSAVLIISGILSVALGIAVLAFCTQALRVLGIVIGIALIIESILDIAALVIGHRRNQAVISIYDTSGDDKDYDLE